MENGQNMYQFSITPSSQTCRLTFTQEIPKVYKFLASCNGIYSYVISVVIWWPWSSSLLCYRESVSTDGALRIVSSCKVSKQCDVQSTWMLREMCSLSECDMQSVWMWCEVCLNVMCSLSECNVHHLPTFINYPTIDAVCSWYWRCC
jgi:hypothetical protein